MNMQRSASLFWAPSLLQKKNECPELMIADFQAHASYLSETRIKHGQSGYFDVAGIPQPKRNEAGLTQIELSAESMRSFKANWEADRQERMTKWRERRDAKRAVSVGLASAPADGQPS